MTNKDEKHKKVEPDSEEAASNAVGKEDIGGVPSNVAIDDEDELEEEPEEIRELERRCEEAEDKYRRALADYHNLQKRVSEERQDWIRSSNKELLLRLLPVLDTLELANKHINDQGLKVSINQFLDTLKAEGVTKIKTVGEEFDPHLMDCVTTEEGEENKVLEELRAGFVLNDKILRPAQVKVGKK
jgi:molecular chaperone GrpE